MPHQTLMYLLLLFFVLFDSTNTQCCLQFKNNQCFKCPPNMHLYEHNCIFDIESCLQYIGGFDCLRCINGFQYDSSTSSCINKYVQLIQHHLTSLRPFVQKLKFINFQTQQLSDSIVIYTLNYQNNISSQKIWFKFESNLQQITFQLIEQNSVKEQNDFYFQINKQDAFKDANFLLLLVHYQIKNPSFAFQEIQSIYTVHNSTIYRIQYFDSSGKVKTENLKDYLSQSQSSGVITQGIQLFISDEALTGQILEGNQKLRVFQAFKQIENANMQIKDSELIEVYKISINNALDKYILYLSVGSKFYQSVMMEQKRIFNRFIMISTNQLN